MTEFIAGGFSGLAQTIVGHPFDTLKVRIQNQKYKLKLPFYKYYRGIGYPMFSNTIVNSILFYQYDEIKNKVNNNFIAGGISGFLASPIIYLFDNGKALRQMGKKVHVRNIIRGTGYPMLTARETTAFSLYFGTYEYFKNKLGLNPLIAGGLSGLVNWTFTYPLDVMRNRQIVNSCSVSEAFKMGNLWKGFALCAVRAIIVNSVGFYVYELSAKHIQL